jgi:hypothetical protein
MTKRSTPEAPQALAKSADQEATAAQAGIEKTLFDELTKGLTYAARSLGALDEQERLTLLAEAEIAYQNAIYLAEQSSTPPESPITQKLHQLGAFLVKTSDNLEEGN